MIEEKFPGNKETENKVQAKVILARCPYEMRKSENVFGMRIQKYGSDWKRTWAFKIDFEKAHHEGYDREITSGSFIPEANYPGCPYCGSMNLAQCSCGKSLCFKSERGFSQREMSLTCPWCGQTGTYKAAENLNLEGGGY